MSPSNVIAIVGATGTQGRTVAQAFFSLPDWQVRALSRDPSSASAKALAAQGAEVVQADLADPESLSRAFEGATDIFVNTDFWAPYVAAMAAGKSREQATPRGFDTELLHAKNAADAAAKIPTLHRIVYSALGPMKAASKGKFSNSAHWDSKAAAADYIEKQRPELKGKVSFIYPGAYHTNPFSLPQRLPHLGEDEWAILLPCPITTQIPIIDMTTTFGALVRALIVDENAGVKLFAYDCNITRSEVIEKWEKFTGKKTRFVQETMESMHKITGLPYEVLDGPAFLGEFHYMAGVEGKVIEPKDLKNPIETKTFEQILEQRGMAEVLGNKYPTL